MPLLIVGLWVVITLLIGGPLLRLIASRFTRAEKQGWTEFIFASTLLGTLLVGWLALALLQLGLFTPVRLLYLLVALAVVICWRAAVRGVRLAPDGVPTLEDGLFLLLFLSAVIILFHPAEFILGGGDAGVYVNLGELWVREGFIWAHEPELTMVPRELLPGLLRAFHSGAPVEYARFPGFYIHPDDLSLIIPQFFPLHPVWLASFNAALGLRASLYVTPLWGALGLLAVALVSKRLVGTPVGLLTGFLLLLTPLQIYFARYPTAESLTQYLTWGALYALIAYLDDENALWAILSGAALGSVFLTRIDALPLLLVPALLLFLLWRKRMSFTGFMGFFLPFGLLTLQALVHAVFLSFPYTLEVYSGLRRLVGTAVRYGFLVLPAIVLLLLFIRVQQIVVGHRIASLARWGVAGMLLALALFAYFVWPHLGESVEADYWYGGHKILVQNHLNLRRLGWYLSPLGIWLGIGGVLLLWLEGRLKRTWPLFATSVPFSVLYIYNILNNPYHIYAMRRYVPVVLPFLVTGMAFALTWLWQRARDRLARILVGVLGVILVTWIGYNSRAVWNLVEYRGLVGNLAGLAERLEPAGVLLFEDEATVGVGATVGTPLQYLHGFTSFDLQETEVDPQALEAGVRHWQARGRPVYWLRAENELGMPPLGELRLQPMDTFQLHYPQLETSYHHFPTRRLERTLFLEVYDVMLPDAVTPCSLPVDIDVGGVDSLYLQKGFYSREEHNDRTLRWTNGEGVLTLPCALEELPEDFWISLDVGVVRAAETGPVYVAVTVGDNLSTWDLDEGFHTLNLQVSRETFHNAPQVVLHSETWVPQEHGVGQDRRVLGLLVDRITLLRKRPE